MLDEFVIFDVETTGLSPWVGDEVCELGAVRLKSRQIVETFQTFVKPKRPIPPDLTKIHGITNEMVADAPPFEAVIPEFFRFCGAALLVAHNAEFDTSFFNERLMAMNGPWPQNVVLDTLRLSRKLYPREARHNLAVLRQRFEVKVETAHRAVDDVVATSHILNRFLDDLRGKGVMDLSGLLMFHGAPVKFAPPKGVRR